MSRQPFRVQSKLRMQITWLILLVRVILNEINTGAASMLKLTARRASSIPSEKPYLELMLQASGDHYRSSIFAFISPPTYSKGCMQLGTAKTSSCSKRQGVSDASNETSDFRDSESNVRDNRCNSSLTQIGSAHPRHGTLKTPLHQGKLENNEKPVGLEEVIKIAAELRRKLHEGSEERRAFFENHYRRELEALGCNSEELSAEAAADRLALARSISTLAVRPSTATAATAVHPHQQDGIFEAVVERKNHSQPQRRRTSAEGAARGLRQQRTVRRAGGLLGGPLVGGIPSIFDMMLGGSLLQGQETGDSETQERHPLEQLLSDIFGGAMEEGGPGGIDPLSQLMRDHTANSGEDRGAARRQLDFASPDMVETEQQQRDAGDLSDIQNEPYLLSLLETAKASKNAESLVNILLKACSDPGMRKLLTLAATEGVEVAQSNAEPAGRYLLTRLQDEGLFE